MPAALLDGRFAVNHVVTLLADERNDLIELFLRVFSPDQSRIERSLRSIGHHILRLLAHVGAAQSTNIQRGLLQQLRKFPASAFWSCDSQLALQFRIIVRQLCDSLLVRVGQRHDVVIVALNEHTPIGVLHRRQQPRQLHRWIRRPVSVMPAVQRAHRPVHRDVHTDVAAVSKENQRPPRLMHRPIRGDKQVCSQQILMQLQRPLQIRRTRFLFSLKNNLEIHT